MATIRWPWLFFREMLLKICCIDEAGELGQLGNPPRRNDQPVLVVGGPFVDAGSLAALTGEFLELKFKFFTGLPTFPKDGRTVSSLRSKDRIFAETQHAEPQGNARTRRVRLMFFGQVAATRQALCSRRSGQRMFSRQHPTPSRALAPAVRGSSTAAPGSIHAEPCRPRLQPSERRNRTPRRGVKQTSAKNVKRIQSQPIDSKFY